MQQRIFSVLSVLALAVMAVSCSQSDALTPTLPSPAPVPSGDSTLKVTAPVPLSPVNAAVLNGNTATLSASSSTALYESAATVQQYYFEVLDGGSNVVDSGLAGSPQWSTTKELAYSATYRWRVRAQQGGGTGPWSGTAEFRTSNPPPPPAPAHPADAHPECGPPSRTSPVSIIQCHRSLYPGRMEPEQAVAMLSGAARHMNMAGVPGGPFGILQKNRGNNCGGYSCDIICSGQGRQQKQYDVLIDERIAKFGSPLGGGQRVDVCVPQ